MDLYSGDEIANSHYFHDYLNEEDKKHDNRWLHRPMMNWVAKFRKLPFSKNCF